MDFTAATLAAAGVRDAAAVASAAAGPVGAWLASHAEAAVVRGLDRAADPRAAVSQLERLVAADARRLEDDAVETLLVVLGASPTLGASLVAEGDGWRRVFSSIADVDGVPAAVQQAALEAELGAEPPSLEALQIVLRRHCRRALLRIGGRDLAGRATVDETVREVSRLADAVVTVALAATRARLQAQWNVAVSVPVVAFGMGKLGGEELNYSSDIDLVFVYERDEPLDGDRSVREFYARVVEEVTRTLAEATPDGRCFRVDLRLRPGGGEGPLAVSLAGLLEYYESWGQTWERAVWLKARPIAGDEALGATVVRELEPFVYRRYLDFGTLGDLEHMRRRVDSSLRDPERRQRDVKLGHGGIREVEFVVQALQLVHGGKDRRVRRRGTLAALARLVATDYVDAATGAALADAYRHLRNVEHKIQIVQQRQSQTIPRAAGEVALMARRLGYGGDDPAATFWQAHAVHTTVVRTTFEAMFRGDEASAGQHDELVPLFDDQQRDLDPAPALARLGFRDVEEAGRSLRLLRDGPRHAPASPRRRQAIVALGPSLLAEIARSGAPDRALRLMAEFVATVGARSSYLQLLERNPATMRLLVRLFASSEFMSRFFIRHPELLDNLVRVDLVRIVCSRDELATELADRLAAAPDLEVELDVIRRFRHEEFLRVGIHDLEGELDGPTVETQLSDLAEVCLEAAVRLATRETRRRTGVSAGPATEALAVIALGKLGGRELNYHSDLDLVFVWDVAEEAWDEPVHPQDFFTRVVQRTISVLQTPTGEGQAYQIDTRLRPSGNQGTLVTSLAAFDAYHRDSAAVWERQALIKARVVSGPAALRDRLAPVIEANVYGRGLLPPEVEDLQRIRRRIESERGAAADIKTGEGGVVDVEFAVHLLQMRYGHENVALRTPAIRTALAALAAGDYMAADVTTALADGYAFLRLLENRLRIERDQAAQVIDDDRGAQLALARRLGYDDDDDAAVARLRADVARHRRAIRDAYDRVIEVVTVA